MRCGSEMNGYEILGATASSGSGAAGSAIEAAVETTGPMRVFTDKDTVKIAQRELHSLSQRFKDPRLDPYTDKGKDDGILGPATRSALQRFNTMYRGEPKDDVYLTEGTLAALKLNPLGVPIEAFIRPGKVSADAALTSGVVTTIEEPFYKKDIAGVPVWIAGLGALGGLLLTAGVVALVRR